MPSESYPGPAAHEHSATSHWSTALAVLCGVVAFNAIPPFPAFYGVDLTFGALLVRAALCGVTVGLGLPRNTGIRTGILAGISAVFGLIVMLLTQSIWIRPLASLTGHSVWLLVFPLISALIAEGARWVATTQPRRAAFTVAALALLLSATWLYGMWGPLAPQQRQHVSSLQGTIGLGMYDFDGDLYMRLAQETERGRGFYEVFLETLRADPRRGPMIDSAFNVRQPELTWFLAALPGPPAAILWWFMTFWCAVCLAALAIGTSFGGLGVGLATGALMMMYGFPSAWLPPQWFMFPEFWSGGLIVLSFMLLLRNMPWFALVALLVAVTFREFGILLIPAFLAWWLLSGPKRPGIAFPLAVSLGPIALLTAHLISVPPLGTDRAINVTAWLHGNWAQFMEAMSFHWAGGIPGLQWTGVLLSVLCIAGALMLASRSRGAMLLLAVVVPSLFLFFFGAGNDTTPNYWGAFIIPLWIAFCLLPFVIVVRRLDVGSETWGAWWLPAKESNAPRA